MNQIRDLMKDCDNGLVPEDNNHVVAQDFLNSLALDLFKFRYRIEMEEK